MINCKCGLCEKKAVAQVRLGNSNDKRNLCMTHYNAYMNAGGEYPIVFRKASEL